MRNEKIISNITHSQKEQQQYTPQHVMDLLKTGNQSYVQSMLTTRYDSDRKSTAENGQFPLAAFVSCMDSRVIVEDIFQLGNGDAFVTRVAGNVINKDILASLEYACISCGAKLVVVMGHSQCGAITSAVDNVKLGNITSLLTKIAPAINKAKTHYKGDQSSNNMQYTNMVCTFNVENAIDEIKKDSPILKDMEAKGEIKIIGAIYHLDTGIVNFLDKQDDYFQE